MRGGISEYVLLNLQDIDSIKPCVEKAVGFYGKIDILVNSAGIHLTRTFADFSNMTEKEYDSIMGINLKGTYFVCQAVSNYMIENEVKGHILNISSSSALEPAWSPYRISKWGIRGITLGLAEVLLPYGITVNAIAPGPTATDMLGVKEGDRIYTDLNPVGRYVMPEEIANCAKLMVSDTGKMIVGDTLYITGGRGTIDMR